MEEAAQTLVELSQSEELPPYAPRLQRNLSYDDEVYARAVKSFQDERSQQFMKWFIGNGSISSTDLEENMCIF